MRLLFFDYLTYPLLTLSMPLVIWLLTYDMPDADMLKKEFYIPPAVFSSVRKAA